MLFDRPGISIRNATHCVCRVLVFASSWLFHLICLLAVRVRWRVGELSCEPNGRLNVCTTSVTEGEVAGVKQVWPPGDSLLTVPGRWF